MDQGGSEGPEKRFKDKSEPIMVERRMRMQVMTSSVLFFENLIEHLR